MIACGAIMRRVVLSGVAFTGALALSVASVSGCAWILGVDQNWEVVDASTVSQESGNETALGEGAAPLDDAMGDQRASVARDALAEAESDAAGTDATTTGDAPDADAAGNAPDADAAGNAPDADAAGNAPDADAAGNAPDADAARNAPDADAAGNAPDAIALSDAGDAAVSQGCGTSSDCPGGQACNPATGLCGTSCAGGLVCHGGCCPASGPPTCQPGTETGACGTTGGTCAVCNHGCSGGVCTCATYVDCPLLQACGIDGACSSSCAGGLKCNFACCDSTFMCHAGFQDNNACGVGTSQCKVCSGATPTCDAGMCI